MRVDDHASVAFAALPRAAPGQSSGGHDAHKASTRRLYARLAYVMRVDKHASVACAAASFRPRPRGKKR
jgi:hypothetical protein